MQTWLVDRWVWPFFVRRTGRVWDVCPLYAYLYLCKLFFFYTYTWSCSRAPRPPSPPLPSQRATGDVGQGAAALFDRVLPLPVALFFPGATSQAASPTSSTLH